MTKIKIAADNGVNSDIHELMKALELNENIQVSVRWRRFAHSQPDVKIKSAAADRCDWLAGELRRLVDSRESDAISIDLHDVYSCIEALQFKANKLRRGIR